MPALPRLAALLLMPACLMAQPAPPAQPSSPLDQAQTHWYSGRQAQALELLEAAVAREGQNAKLRFTLAWMVQERGELARAESLLRALLEEFPDHAEAHNNLAVILAQRGELDGAHQALLRATALQPGHAQAQENLGDLLLRLAQRAYGQAARNQPQAALQLKLRQLEALIHNPKP